MRWFLSFPSVINLKKKRNAIQLWHVCENIHVIWNMQLAKVVAKYNRKNPQKKTPHCYRAIHSINTCDCTTSMDTTSICVYIGCNISQTVAHCHCLLRKIAFNSINLFKCEIFSAIVHPVTRYALCITCVDSIPCTKIDFVCAVLMVACVPFHFFSITAT